MTLNIENNFQGNISQIIGSDGRNHFIGIRQVRKKQILAALNDIDFYPVFIPGDVVAQESQHDLFNHFLGYFSGFTDFCKRKQRSQHPQQDHPAPWPHPLPVIGSNYAFAIFPDIFHHLDPPALLYAHAD